MPKLFTKRAVVVVLILFGVVALFFVGSTVAFKSAQGLVTALLKPVQEVFRVTAEKVQNLFSNFTSKKTLETENNSLTERVHQLESKIVTLQTLLDETRALDEELTFAREHKYEYVASKVIARSPDNPNALIINKGQNHNLQNGMPVIVGDGILVGKIIETNANTAIVLLIIDSQSTITAVVQNDDAPYGVINGAFGLSLKMDLIPQEKRVEAGEWVVTSGQESFIPAGLTIGQIDAVSAKPGALFKQATIIPSVSTQQFQIVTVIIS